MERNNDIDVQRLSDFLLNYAINLMARGAHTARVNRNVIRIAESYGYVADMIIFPLNITMTLMDKIDHSIRRTYVRKSKVLPIDFLKIKKLSSLSWETKDNYIPLDLLEEKYDNIINEPPLSRWIVLLGVSVGSSAFGRLFDGDLNSILILFISTFVGMFARQELNKRHYDQRFILFIVALLSSFTAALLIHFGITKTPNIVLAASILFLIPGVPLINSMIDILDGHILMGVSRAISVAILTTCVAFGLYITLTLQAKGII